jgi:propionate CoA-transferase
VRKFVPAVEQVSFAAAAALAKGRPVLYVTERAVFRLGTDGVELVEVAPGIDVEADVIARMGFRPLVRQVRPMPAACFAPPPRA